jgi:crossover junction endodeoxyribonuclease RuvC
MAGEEFGQAPSGGARVPRRRITSARLWRAGPKNGPGAEKPAGCQTMGITPEQFEQMQRRLNGRSRLEGSPTRSGPAVDSASPALILGVDPSLRGTGFGVVRTFRRQSEALTYGTIRCPAGWSRSRCLVRIVEVLRGVIREFHPTVCAMEGLFYAQNLKTALIMGEARGASMAAIAEAGLEIVELAPRKVKQAIVGYGAAQKLAVAKMVQRMLGLAEVPPADAADALALALVHTQQTGSPLLGQIRKL